MVAYLYKLTPEQVLDFTVPQVELWLRMAQYVEGGKEEPREKQVSLDEIGKVERREMRAPDDLKARILREMQEKTKWTNQ